MRINAQTKIAALLKGHPGALEAIVPLSADFKKLRNPLLRKLMAGRTTIAMASKIGGCTPEDFYRALAPLGFECEAAPAAPPLPAQAPRPLALASLNADNLVKLDVRALLASGNDPLKLIQQTVKNLQPGQVLQLVNTFEPTPLIHLLGRQGFQAYAEHEGPDLVITYFYKEVNAPAASQTTEQPKPAAQSWEALMAHFAGKLAEVDVRHLEMPQPMMTILAALDELPEDHALYVLHKRIPVFLLDELAARQCHYSIRETGPGEVFLLIYKNQA